MWELDHKEGWAPKNWCFQIVLLEKTLENPLYCKEITAFIVSHRFWVVVFSFSLVFLCIFWFLQSILKEINPEYSLEELILKIQYFGHLMQSVDSLEKTPCLERFRLGGKGGNRGWDGWMVSLIQWTWIWANSEMVKDREAWHAAVHGVTKSFTRLSDWRTRRFSKNLGGQPYNF